MVEILLIGIDLINQLLIVNLGIKIGLSLLDGVHPSEVIGAPHLVGVQLIRASELVPVLSGVHACV